MSTNFCFTLNNPTDAKKASLEALFPAIIKYLVYGNEVAPTTGMHHIQDYAQTIKQYRLPAFAALIPGCQVEKPKGSAALNKTYCTKEGDSVELGEPTIAGRSINSSINNTITVTAHVKRKSCPHETRKSRCIKCGGSEICEHEIRKSRCTKCGGIEICEHKKYKSVCKLCVGGSICEHLKVRSVCKECIDRVVFSRTHDISKEVMV
jgi:hypothetical protein